ncbi:MAG: PKD domain-containing protein [Bacteroidetes bacterium]|nr:PKD domain-containing protein [Bacteroidota bacterium]
MKKIIILLFFASSFSLFHSYEAKASHMAGGQITYTHTAGLTYNITYTFYRDCSGIPAPATVPIVITSANASFTATVTSGAGVNNGNVVPVCPTATTTCSGGATPGREKWVYTASVTLPSAQTDWNFSVSQTARNAAITTIVSPGTMAMYVYATLNNTITPGNNASFFANDPAAFVYTGQTFCFNNGAVDIDGDSVAYSLITPLIDPVNTVTYTGTYTPTQPLTSTPPVTFNATTGDVCMFPTASGEVTVMAILVKEYRYGILIGSVERDIQVSVLAGADNLPTLNGINATNTYIDTAVVGCAYSFTTGAADADAAQCVTMTSTATAAIPASTFVVANGCPSLTRPTGTFSWTPAPADALNYPHYFTVTARDNFCNIEGQTVKAYGIQVINLNANFTSTAPSCVGQAVNFYADWVISNYSYLWNFGSGSVATFAMATSPNPAGVSYTTSGAKTVKLTITTPGGCVITNSQVITINPSPTASFTSTAPQCTGSAVDFTNTGSTGAGTIYAWSFGAGASPATSTAQNPTGIMYSTAGTKTVTQTITNNFGCVTSATQTLTINQTPVASFSSTAPACTGMNVNFTNTGTATSVTWLWNFGSGATPATSTLQNPTAITYSTSGTKSVTLTTTSTTSTCSATAMQTINIAQTPAPLFTSNAPQCVGSQVNFTYTGTTGTGWNYSWDFGAGATPALSSAQNPSSVIYSTSGTKTITLTVDNNGFCPSTYTATIVISATPVANFSSTAPQCTGMPVDFTNTGTAAGVTWAWNFGSGAAPATSTLQNPTGIIYSTAGTKSVTLTITNSATGCTSTISKTININQSPTVTFTSNAPQCANTGVNFTNTGSSGGQWTYFWDFGVGAMPQTSTAQNPSGILYATAGTKTITLTISDGTCSGVATQTITVNPSPVASFTSNAPMCTGDSVNFQNTGTSGAMYSWSFGNGSAPATSTAQNPMGVIYSIAGLQTVTLVTTLGSCTDTSMQTILINQTPSVNFNSTAPQCVGNAVNFMNTGSTGGNWTFSWSFGAGAMPQISSNENPNGIMYSTAGTKTITLTISDGTCSATKTDTLLINALPLANAGKDTVICNNDSVQIGSAPVAGNTYSWFPASTLNNPAIANPVASPIAPTTNYIVTVTNTATGCTNTDSVVVTMLAPLFALAGPDVAICEYDSIQIGAALITGQNYSWSPSVGLSSATSPNPMASPDSTTTYTLSVTGPGCGPVMDEITVTVHELPNAEAGPNDTITVGSSTQLTATGGVEYTWSPATGLSNISIYNPIANPTVTTTYIVTVMDVFGCVNTDSVTIYVIEPTFWVPTAFTPNGDMQNDVLFAHGEGIDGFEFGIYNRWGELVWSTKDIKVGWDGRRQIGGQELPEGAYVYYVKGTLTNGDVINTSGLINLIR